MSGLHIKQPPITLFGTFVAAVLFLVSCSSSNIEGSSDSTAAGAEATSTLPETDSSSTLDPSSVPGGNSAEEIANTVAEFNAQGLDFSPEILKSSIPDDCNAVDVEAVSAILEIDVIVSERATFFPTEEGYLTCSFHSSQDTNVAMAYAHFGPDLEGDQPGFDGGWAVVGTREGASEIDDLADDAVWSDGSNSANQTDKTMIQLRVNQEGTQSLIQLQNNDPQRELGADWSVSKAVFALAKINETLVSTE